jgi:hypothetical protein
VGNYALCAGNQALALKLIITMGGSGSSYTPRGKKLDCSEIEFKTAVNSPVNLGLVQINDILDLKKNEQMEVLFIHKNGIVIGKLFSGNLLSVIGCITKGYEYSAQVNEVTGDICRVTVWCTKSPKK